MHPKRLRKVQAQCSNFVLINAAQKIGLINLMNVCE